jgi:hypothetical protein
MVICPVCEHAQEVGGECLVCGRSLVESGAPDDVVERLPGLEPTRLEVAPAPPVHRMEDLEPTLFEVPAVPAALEEPATWIERIPREPASSMTPASIAAMKSLEMESLAMESLQIERTALAAPDAPTGDLLAPPVCRYCRTSAAPGELFCGRCGLRLATYSGEHVVPAGDVRRCRFCGARGPGETCQACGARLGEA